IFSFKKSCCQRQHRHLAQKVADESELSSATFYARCLHHYDDASFLKLKIKNTETQGINILQAYKSIL
ncbi:MAG: hypothetical protein K2J91_05985, partial [Lachnospiraceae bacterium]|nr:hypothetical protein [Lachnospiraceae bacterium]